MELWMLVVILETNNDERQFFDLLCELTTKTGLATDEGWCSSDGKVMTLDILGISEIYD